MLTIDLGSCVDCGQCVRACADAHGVSRFARHGERVTAVVDAGAGLRERAYLLPNACQHCSSAACLSECPTGALARDARGGVEIRTELCTGCGACVSACPWDAVKLTPSGTGAVAIKCDLCRGREGPECVLACPTGAAVRVEPARDFAELRVALGGRRRKRWETSIVGPWLARAATLPPLAVALSLAGRAGASVRLSAGIVGGVLLIVLLLHAAVKRVPSARRQVGRLLRRGFGDRASLAPLVGLHTALGVLSLGAILVHTNGRFGAGVAGMLTLSFWLVAGTGALGGAAYALVPPRLARLEPQREPSPGAAELDRRLFAALSGQNDAVRALATVFLIPHARGVAGALLLLCSSRAPADEERALSANVRQALRGRASARLGDVDSIVRAAVAVRAARAARFGRALLGAFVPLHFMLAAWCVLLLVIHVVGAVR